MRILHALLWCSCGVAAACSGNEVTPPTTARPVSPPVAAPGPGLPGPSLANWQGDATVLFRTGTGGCGWGTTVGESRAGVLWRVSITDTAVALDEDMGNFPTDHIPYKGTRSGQTFAATYAQRIDGACLWAGGDIAGTFLPDFTSFEAQETVRWGRPGAETTVQRQWQVRQR